MYFTEVTVAGLMTVTLSYLLRGGYLCSGCIIYVPTFPLVTRNEKVKLVIGSLTSQSAPLCHSLKTL